MSYVLLPKSRYESLTSLPALSVSVCYESAAIDAFLPIIVDQSQQVCAVSG